MSLVERKVHFDEKNVRKTSNRDKHIIIPVVLVTSLSLSGALFITGTVLLVISLKTIRKTSLQSLALKNGIKGQILETEPKNDTIQCLCSCGNNQSINTIVEQKSEPQ